MSKVFSVELASGKGCYCELDLPATDYQLLDALERLRMQPGEQPDWEITEFHGFSYLDPLLARGTFFYELNALTRKLAEMDRRQSTAFEGLVKMEVEKKEWPIQVPRFLDLTYSTECCKVVEEALNDSQLGRFYADNGFLPKIDKVPDEVYDLLDFERLGREARLGECGVFTSHGYVVQDSDLMEVSGALDCRPHKPDYVFRVGIRRKDPESSVDGGKTVFLDLPATAAQFEAALDQVGAQSRYGLVMTSLDGPLTSMDHDLFYMDDLPKLNELAKCIRQIEKDDRLILFKAVLCAQDCHQIDRAIALVGTLDDYFYEPNLRSPEEVAREELSVTVSDKDAELILKHLNLYAYGQELLDRDCAALTDYGLLERREEQSIRLRQGSPSSGMTMI